MAYQPRGAQKPQSYKDLEIYQIARVLAVRVHKMSLEKLPKFEMFEEGSQIRRSAKSIHTNKELYEDLFQAYESLGRKIYRFREFIIASEL